MKMFRSYDRIRMKIIFERGNIVILFPEQKMKSRKDFVQSRHDALCNSNSQNF